MYTVHGIYWMAHLLVGNEGLNQEVFEDAFSLSHLRDREMFILKAYACPQG